MKITERSKWEYTSKFIYFNEMDELNRMGDEGWELVSINIISEYFGYCIFKRIKIKL